MNPGSLVQGFILFKPLFYSAISSINRKRTVQQRNLVVFSQTSGRKNQIVFFRDLESYCDQPDYDVAVFMALSAELATHCVLKFYFIPNRPDYLSCPSSNISHSNI